jgi:hypothetical protein
MNVAKQGVFLNFEAPSQCRGFVSSWEFCHYTSGSAGDDVQYRARIIVYRRTSSVSGAYEAVAESVTDIVLPYSEASIGFRCLKENLTESFEILENDVIGACIRNQPTQSAGPLYLIGEDQDQSTADQKLYHFDRPNWQWCTDVQIMTINTESTSFSLIQVPRSRLHLYANIGMSMIPIHA